MTVKLTDEEKEEQWGTTVETLQRFYSVIIAIALTSGLAKLILSLEDSASYLMDIGLVALSVALLSTIIPFYHGMERHLYITHILRPKLGAGGKPIPLLVDVLAFIVEGGILFAMGRKLDQPIVFLRLWTALLAIDIIWTLIVWRVEKGTRPIWAMNNFIWLCIAWAVWLGSPWVLFKAGVSLPDQIPVMVWLIALIEIGRSVTDYRANWAFYFPDDHRRSQLQAVPKAD
jgi:hypothetical protein